MLAYTRIGRPREAHEVQTATAYRRWHAAQIQRAKRARPSLPWRPPFEAQITARPEIRQGRWVLACPCGNAPSYDPDWQLACCVECGAVYTVAPPPDAAQIEAVLMMRPRMQNRNYLATETVTELRVENLAHGVAWPG